MRRIKIIIGSTRPGRFGPKLAQWLYGLAKEREDARYEIVDLAKLGLPLLDEAVPAAAGQYEHEHTKRWAAIVDEADGFIFVTPEYNHGVSGALKNAIDFVGAEWYYKPVAFASYGAAAGGTRAVEQLRQIGANVRWFDLNDALLFVNYWTQLDERGEFVPTGQQERFAREMLDELVFWTDQLARSRREHAERREAVTAQAS